MTESPPIAKSLPAAHPTTTATALAFTAGFVDTLGFILLGGVFTAHVTGNFVLIGATLATSPDGVLAKLSTLPAFFAAVVVVTAIAASITKASSSRGLALILGLEALFLAVFLALGIAGQPFTDLDGPMTVLAAMTGAVAMGLQNAAARLHLAQLPPSTMMTGNVTQIGIDIADVIFRRDAFQRTGTSLHASRPYVLDGAELRDWRPTRRPCSHQDRLLGHGLAGGSCRDTELPCRHGRSRRATPSPTQSLGPSCLTSCHSLSVLGLVVSLRVSRHALAGAANHPGLLGMLAFEQLVGYLRGHLEAVRSNEALAIDAHLRPNRAGSVTIGAVAPLRRLRCGSPEGAAIRASVPSGGSHRREARRTGRLRYPVHNMPTALATSPCRAPP